LTEWKQNYYDLSKLKISPEELHALEVQVETYINEKELIFVEFTGYHSKSVGDETNSDIEGWFKSETKPNLYVKFEAKFSGVGGKLNLVDAHGTPVLGNFDFSSPANVLTLSQIGNLSFIKLASIFLALACLCLSGIAFMQCIFNWRDGESKFWAIPVLFGVAPIKVQLWGSAISWKIATVTCPAGWLANTPLALGIYLTYEGQKAAEVSGQVALFSFPIALFHFLRRTDKDFNSEIEAKADNTLDNLK
jgi:hypothetical protein